MTRTENFTGGDVFAALSDSKGFDRRLFDADARVGAAHCDALFHAGVLTRGEAERIKNGLQALQKRAGFDANYFNELERAGDVHEFADARLAQLVGETARKLNAGRTKRDRAATVFRLWLREEIEKISRRARGLQKALVEAATRAGDAVLDGHAFSENAQPILLAHWCLAYFEAAARDRERLDEVWRRANVLPLGAGDGAGVNFEIDAEETARALRFEGVALNSLDAVSDTDFAVEFVGACALLAAHLARLAADLNALAAEEFWLVEFSVEAIQAAKITAALRAIRAKAATVFGFQAALFSPDARGDLNETKRAVFDAADTIEICLEAAAQILNRMRAGERTTRGAQLNNRAAAVELRDYLLHKNADYQVACEAVEKIRALADREAKRIGEIDLPRMQQFSALIDADVFDALSLRQAVGAKSQIGGTAPERVFEALEAARASLDMEE